MTKRAIKVHYDLIKTIKDKKNSIKVNKMEKQEKKTIKRSNGTFQIMMI